MAARKRAKKMLFIFNPHTGGGRLKNKLMDIVCRFAEEGYDVTVHPTQARGDACDTTKARSEKFDILVCCGGDGTLNEVVDGLSQVEKPPVLGYIPGGTTNDFASSLKLPRADMLKATERIIKPKKIFACDYAKMNDRVFNYVAAFGAFTDVAYSTPQKFKNVFGYSAYILEGIQRLPNLEPYKARVVCDEGEYEEEFLFGMVSNSTSVGGFHFFDQKEVHMDDGYFEVLLVRKPHGLAELGELSSALLKRNVESPALLPLRVKEIQIIGADQAIPWTVDGEFGGAMQCADIKVQQQGLKICT